MIRSLWREYHSILESDKLLHEKERALQDLFYIALKRRAYRLALYCALKQRDESLRANLLSSLTKKIFETSCYSKYLCLRIIKALYPLKYTYEAILCFRLLIEKLSEFTQDEMILKKINTLIFKKREESERVEYLSPLIFYFIKQRNYNNAERLIESAESLILKKDSPREMAYAYSILAFSLTKASETKKGIYYFRLAEKTIRKISDPYIVYIEYIRIIRYLYILNHKDDARKCLIRSFLYLVNILPQFSSKTKDIFYILHKLIKDMPKYGEISIYRRALKLYNRLICHYPLKIPSFSV